MSDFSGTVPEVIKYRQLPIGPRTARKIASSGGEAPNCEVQHPVDLANVRQLHSKLLPVEKAQRMAEFFSLMGDANRLRILSVLAIRELCVCDLAGLIKMSESAVSHQLRVLRSMGLVNYRKQGRNVFYSLSDSHALNIYRELLSHLDFSRSVRLPDT